MNGSELSISAVFVRFVLLLFMNYSVEQSDLSGGSVGTPTPDEQKFPEGVELFLIPIRQYGILWCRMVEPCPPGTLILAHLDARKHNLSRSMCSSCTCLNVNGCGLYLGQDLGEWRQAGQLHQVEPGLIQDPAPWFGFYRVQI